MPIDRWNSAAQPLKFRIEIKVRQQHSANHEELAELSCPNNRPSDRKSPLQTKISPGNCPNIQLVCDVISAMEVMSMTQARPNLNKRPQREAEGEQEIADEDTASGQRDLYGMLGYRARRTSGITTQQWLAFRLIEL